MKSIILKALMAVFCVAGIAYHDFRTREELSNQPIRCASPIDPELHIVVKDGELDTTFVYYRNIER